MNIVLKIFNTIFMKHEYVFALMWTIFYTIKIIEFRKPLINRPHSLRLPLIQNIIQGAEDSIQLFNQSLWKEKKQKQFYSSRCVSAIASIQEYVN